MGNIIKVDLDVCRSIKKMGFVHRIYQIFDYKAVAKPAKFQIVKRLNDIQDSSVRVKSCLLWRTFTFSNRWQFFCVSNGRRKVYFETVCLR